MTYRPNATALDKLVTQAIDKFASVRKLENIGKLSGEAFVARACELAGIDPSQLPALEAKIEKRKMHAAASFVRTMSRAFKESNWPTPPDDAAKILGAYGTAEAGTQLAELKSSTAEAIALAASISVKLFPERFGAVRDFEAHNKALKAARRELDTFFEQMREEFTAKDIEFDITRCSANERRTGLLRCWFKRWPAVSLGDPDWPAAILNLAFTTLAANPPPKRKASKAAPEPDEDTDQDEDEDEAAKPPPGPAKSPRRHIKRRRLDDDLPAEQPVTD